MINGFSKFAVLYLAPVLMLTALFLSLFAFLAPSGMLHDQVALLTVLPSTALTNPQATASDGPSLFIGALGMFYPTPSEKLGTQQSRRLMLSSQ